MKMPTLVGLLFTLISNTVETRAAVIIETLQAEGIVSDRVVGRGVVMPKKRPARLACQIREAGKRRWLGHTPWQRITRGHTNVEFSVSVTNLAFDTEYEMRSVAIIAGVRRNGNTVSFHSASGAPDIQLLNPTNITSSNAVLVGSVVPNASDTTAWFEWGTATNYGNGTPRQGIPGGVNPRIVTAALGMLAESTTYHYRLVASNATSLTLGEDAAFVATDYLTLHQGDVWTFNFTNLPLVESSIGLNTHFLGSAALNLLPDSFSAEGVLHCDLITVPIGSYLSTNITAPASGFYLQAPSLWQAFGRQGRVQLTMITGSVVATSLTINAYVSEPLEWQPPQPPLYRNDLYTTNVTLRALP